MTLSRHLQHSCINIFWYKWWPIKYNPGKLDQTDLVLGLLSELTSRSVHTELQVSYAMVMACATLVSIQTHGQTYNWQLLIIYTVGSASWAEQFNLQISLVMLAFVSFAVVLYSVNNIVSLSCYCGRCTIVVVLGWSWMSISRCWSQCSDWLDAWLCSTAWIWR